MIGLNNLAIFHGANIDGHIDLPGSRAGYHAGLPDRRGRRLGGAASRPAKMDCGSGRRLRRLAPQCTVRWTR